MEVVAHTYGTRMVASVFLSANPVAAVAMTITGFVLVKGCCDADADADRRCWRMQRGKHTVGISRRNTHMTKNPVPSR